MAKRSRSNARYDELQAKLVDLDFGKKLFALLGTVEL